ncbi:MAG TPA: hypothetical protein VFB68_16865 [Xanthobacteraceae bacterium]|nr:hypothetical protein [Xanthobacteraceae bacterium]
MTTTLMMTIRLSTSQVLVTTGLPSTSTGDTNFREKRGESFATAHRGIWPPDYGVGDVASGFLMAAGGTGLIVNMIALSKNLWKNI